MRLLAQILQLGADVQEEARTTPPAARSVVVVTSTNDIDVNNDLIEIVVKNWSAKGSKSTFTNPRHVCECLMIR